LYLDKGEIFVIAQLEILPLFRFGDFLAIDDFLDLFFFFMSVFHIPPSESGFGAMNACCIGEDIGCCIYAFERLSDKSIGGVCETANATLSFGRRVRTDLERTFTVEVGNASCYRSHGGRREDRVNLYKYIRLEGHVCGKARYRAL
jgi:hypothetical protein